MLVNSQQAVVPCVCTPARSALGKPGRQVVARSHSASQRAAPAPHANRKSTSLSSTKSIYQVNYFSPLGSRSVSQPTRSEASKSGSN